MRPLQTKLLAEKKINQYSGIERLRKQLAETDTEISNIMKAIKAGIITSTTKMELKKAEVQKQKFASNFPVKI